MSCPPEDDAHSRLIERPAHRQGEQTLAIPLLRQLREPLHSRNILRETRRLKLGIFPAHIIRFQPGVCVNLAGEQSPAQRLVGKSGHAVLLAPSNYAFGAALKDIIYGGCAEASGATSRKRSISSTE